MSQALVGGLIGIVGSAAIVKRVREIKMIYTTSGEYSNVVIAVCVDQLCNVDHVDVDGRVYNDIPLSANDMIVGGKVTVKSGRMLIMTAETAGMI
jgi:hypothetical protein